MEEDFNDIKSVINGFKSTYTCSECGNTQSTNLLPYINFSKNPEYYALVKDLSIFKVKCEKCGYETFIKFDTLIIDETHKYFLFFLSDKDALNKIKYQITYFIETSLNKDSKYDLKDYKTRIVLNLNDIIEKMNIFEIGLNDEIIELIKSAIYEKKIVDENIYDSIFFDGMEKTNLIFIAFNSRTSSNKIQKVLIDFNFYNRINDKMKNINARHKEYFEVIDRNWVSINFKFDEQEKKNDILKS